MSLFVSHSRRDAIRPRVRRLVLNWLLIDLAFVSTAYTLSVGAAYILWTRGFRGAVVLRGAFYLVWHIAWPSSRAQEHTRLCAAAHPSSDQPS